MVLVTDTQFTTHCFYAAARVKPLWSSAYTSGKAIICHHAVNITIRAPVFRGKFCQIPCCNWWNSTAYYPQIPYILRPVGNVVLTDNNSKYKKFIVTCNTKTHYIRPLMMKIHVIVLIIMGHSVSNQPKFMKLETRPSQNFPKKLPYVLEHVFSIRAKFQPSILYTCWDNELLTWVVSTGSCVA